MRLLSSAAAAAALALSAPAAAQIIYDVGSWELVQPSTSTPGPAGFVAHHPAMLPGAFLINGQNPATNANATFSFDIAAGAWSLTPDFPFTVQYPFLLTHGGMIIQMTGGNLYSPNQMAFISSSSAASSWTTVNIPGTIPLRVGQRYINWGGIVYMQGGFTLDGVFQNDMWAIDMDAVIANPATPPSWVQVTANSSTTSGPTGMPPPRALHSFDPYGHIATLYGGVSANPGVSPFQCVAVGPTPIDPSCHFHESIWIFMPGQTVSPAVGIHPITSAAWTWVQPSGVEGGPVPAGRFGHASGHYGDLLYVFGGFTAQGAVNDLWTFVLPLRQWVPVQQVAPWPTLGGGFPQYGGLVVGRHLYVYLDSGAQNQLWRWSHSISIPPQAGSGNAVVFPPHPGTVAGLTIGILLGLVNLAGVYIIWKRGKGTVNAASASVPIPDIYSALPQGM